MVQVIIKAFNVLEFVSRDATRSYSLPEIAEGLQLHQATCANIIKTLVELNYLEHLGRKKGYRLGPMAYNLTNNQAYSQTLIEAAREVMETLTHTLNETSILGIIRNNKRFIIHIVHSDQDLAVRGRTERNIYETATGRLLMAFMTPKERASLVQLIGLPTKETWPEATTEEGLTQALDAIKSGELAETLSFSHIVGLAVPIRKGLQVIASLSIFLPEIRCSAGRKAELIHALHAAARQINRRLATLYAGE